MFLKRYSKKLVFICLVSLLTACGGKQKSTSEQDLVPTSGKSPIPTTSKAVKLISPVGEIPHGSVIFTWNEVVNATDYELAIDFETSGKKDFKTALNKNVCKSLKQCSFTPVFKFEQGDHFTWAVKSKVAGSWSSFSQSKAVTIKIIPIPPIQIASGKLLPPENGKIYFGAFADFGGTEDEVSKDKITHFDNLSGKPTAWSYFSNNWYEYQGYDRIPTIKYPEENINTIHNLGKTPFVRILPWTRPKQINHLSETTRLSAGSDLMGICHKVSAYDYVNHLISESEWDAHEQHGDWQGHCDGSFTMQNIISGKWDENLKQWARDAKSHRDDKGEVIPLLVTFTIEMNGYWFPWSGIYNGGARKDGYGDKSLADGPERYRDAYRHIINLFKAEKVTNITWFFIPDTLDPNEDWVKFLIEPWNNQKNYYPGDDYIDWIGTNLYGAAAKDYNWTNFSDDLSIKAKAIKDITSKKPIALMEFGVIEDHPKGTKSEWLEDTFNTLLNGDYLNFKAISYWHDDLGSGTDGMKIDSSPKSLATFQRLIKDPRFSSSLNFK
ncbi:MAG: glycosyl hydrolase [Methylococcaceae bacterium]